MLLIGNCKLKMFQRDKW